jgi:hypothetical protein
METQEIYTARPMVDLIQEVTGEVIAKKGDTFVYLSTKEPVEKEFLDEAIELESKEHTDFDAEQAIKDKKYNGVSYTLNDVDYMISLSSDDAMGMLQVQSAFNLGLEETNIHFVNGTVLPIKAEDFEDFALFFVTERNSFFA